MAWNRLSGIGTGPAVNQLADPFRIPSASSHIRERTDYGPDHISEEPVSPDPEYQVVPLFIREAQQGSVRRPVCSPSGFAYRAYRSPVVSSGLFETAEIMGALKKSRAFVHCFHVKPVSAVPGKTVYERIFFPMDKITVFS